MRFTTDDIIQALKQTDLKVTQQRIVILKSLWQAKHHPSAEQLFDSIKDENPTLSTGTLYKTLETFVENGLVQKVMTKDGAMRYDGNCEDHHHVYVKNTGEILDFEDSELNELIGNYFKSKNIENLKIDNISIQINGEKINQNKNINFN